MKHEARRIYTIDIGSPAKGLAWARLLETEELPEGSCDLELFAQCLCRDLEHGRSVALGFEAPVFLPVAREVESLCRARTGEGQRPWSAGAGVYVSTVVIPIAAWVLDRAAKACPPRPLQLTFDATRWAPTSTEQTEPTLLLWEAFVSGEGHARDANGHGLPEHVQDAATACLAFRDWAASSPRRESAVSAERRINTVAAAAAWAGWPLAAEMLQAGALVLWPNVSLGHGVRPAR